MNKDILKIMFFLIILILSSSSWADRCVENRAAIDIGSGTTKLKVAQVDVCKQKIIKYLYQEEKAVAYKAHLLTSVNKSISQEFAQKGLMVLKALKQNAKKYKPIKFRAAATSVFRTAKNSRVIINNFREQLRIDIHVISQEREGRLGFYGAAARVKDNIEDIVVWDIGGGSMQFSFINKKGAQKNKQDLAIHNSKSIRQGKVQVKGYKIASESFKKILIQSKGLDIRAHSTPNPLDSKALVVGKKVALNMKKSFLSYDNYKNKKFYGIGGLHYYSIKGQVKKAKYTSKDIAQVLQKKWGLTDKNIGGDYAPLQVSNLVLVYSVMNSFKISSVEAIKVNLADGLLVEND